MQLTEEQVPVVLAALYNNAVMGGGMAMLHYKPEEMTVEEAKEIVVRCTEGEYSSFYFDYLMGRPLKMDLEPGKELRFLLYDRDNGEGRGEEVTKKALEGSSDPDHEKLFQQLVYWDFVSKDCTMNRQMVVMIHVVNEGTGRTSMSQKHLRPEGETPCSGCNADREKCHGHPKGFHKTWE